VLDQAARLQAPLAARFACLCHDLGKGSTPPAEWPRHIAHEARSERLTRALAARLKPPTEATELALLVAREHTNIHRSAELGPAALLRLLERCDAFRRPQRFAEALLACEADARGRLGFEERAYPQRPLLAQALAVASGIDAAGVAAAAMARGAQGPAIAKAIAQAREAALAAALTAADARP
jgi:tRNA nucleotidyltransferase (CCA-adding enzyme)